VHPPPLSGTWVSCVRPDPAAPLRLWCLPYAGGGTSAWNAWTAPLAGAAEIAGLRPPGRESRLREPPLRRGEPIVADLLPRLEPHLSRPYALAGHSLGALLAFELARAIRARGWPAPTALVVTGARAPDQPRREPDLHGLPDAEFLTELERRYQGIPPAVRAEPELLALLLPVMRADLEVFETYSHAPGPPLEVPILALGGRSDPHVAPAELEAWRTHTAAAFAAELFPGGHFFVQSELPAVAARVRRFLAGN
jgi:medium-chain acyl-[acyl-carrier-protein] hydrolase